MHCCLLLCNPTVATYPMLWICTHYILVFVAWWLHFKLLNCRDNCLSILICWVHHTDIMLGTCSAVCFKVQIWMQLGTEWNYSWQSSTKVFIFKITFYALLCHINISSQGENPNNTEHTAMNWKMRGCIL